MAATTTSNFESKSEQQKQHPLQQQRQEQSSCRPVPKPRRSLLHNNNNDDKNVESNNINNILRNGSFENWSYVTPKGNAMSKANGLATLSQFDQCQSMNTPVSKDRTSALTSNLEEYFSPQKTPPPSCPVRRFRPSSPPPLPPRNPAARLPSPVCEKDEKSVVSNIYAIPATSDALPKTIVNDDDDENSLCYYMNTAPSISSDCSTSCSSQSSHFMGNHPASAIDHVVDSAAHSSMIYSCLNIANIISSDCKSAGESVCFFGWIRITSLPSSISLKKDADCKRRCWALVRHNQLSFWKNDEAVSPFLGPFDMYRCIFVGRVTENPTEVVVIFRDISLNGSAKSSHFPWSQFKFVPEENVDFWTIFLAKCQSPQVDVVQSALEQVDACGKLWIRQGISGTWIDGWASVHARIFTYWTQGASALAFTDVRKIIMMKRDVPIADYCNFIENSITGPILIALNGSSLYLQAECDMCTDIWYNFLMKELRYGGDLLEENRLTADNVPVIVDKCIRLVATYGLNQTGIYRRNGSAALARELLAKFREDPFNVQMKSVSEESINAVADILRSFFRQLCKPLIPEELHDTLYHITEQMPEEQRIGAYQTVIFSLPVVYFNTLKRLLAHLQQITANSIKNLATVDNIAKVFGPTVFTVDKNNQEVSVETYAKAVRQTAVMRNLLLAFDAIFQTPEEEIHAITKLNELQEQKCNPKARAEGFLVPIHLIEKDNKCFNVQCEWNAAQAVEFRVEKLLMSSDASLADAYALYEVAKNGQLERRISGDESLKSIVLGRWLEWENAATDCYLLLKKNVSPFQPQNVRPFADNIKFAEPGSKSFKTCQLRMECGTKVVQYSKTMKQQSEWIVDETLWFVGHESERKPPYLNTLTFFTIGCTNSTKYGMRFAGYCVAFKDEVQLEQWLNSVIVCRQEYLPTPLVQI